MGKYSGIDVSKWQGRIDWSLVKNDGIQFAMIRSTFGWGQGSEDFLFKTNYENAKKVDMPVGVYHYSYARTPEEAVKEADFCHSVIKGKKFEYPVAYDMEESGVASLGKERVSAIAKAFCERMQSYGYYVCIYANKHWLENYFTNEILENYDIWLAQWGVSSPSKTCGMWQYGADSFGGYSNLDADISYVDYPYYINKNGLHGKNKKSTSTTTTKNDKKTETTKPKKDKTTIINNSVNYFKKNKASKYYDKAQQVIAGKYKTGNDRKKLLNAEGYDYDIVQNIVNDILG